jgi:hypothetical protein
MKKIIIAITIILLLSACENEVQVFSLKTEDLSAQIFYDLEAGNEKYKNQKVELTGVIVEVQENSNIANLIFNGNVKCTINNVDEQPIDINVFSKVSFTGTVTETTISDGYITISDCNITSLIDEPELVTTSVDILSINLDDYDNEVIEITGTVLLVNNSDPTSIYLQSGVQLKQGIQVFLNPLMVTDLSMGDTVTVKVVVIKDSSTFGYFFTGFELEKE